MISKKTKYGLLALLRLAREYGRGPLLIAELAETERIPRKFLELMLLQLKNAGLLASRKGRGVVISFPGNRPLLPWGRPFGCRKGRWPRLLV